MKGRGDLVDVSEDERIFKIYMKEVRYEICLQNF